MARKSEVPESWIRKAGSVRRNKSYGAQKMIPSTAAPVRGTSKAQRRFYPLLRPGTSRSHPPRQSGWVLLGRFDVGAGLLDAAFG
jgi:hypothetical protein